MGGRESEREGVGEIGSAVVRRGGGSSSESEEEADGDDPDEEFDGDGAGERAIGMLKYSRSSRLCSSGAFFPVFLRSSVLRRLVRADHSCGTALFE
jgi:hypothetical protein